MASAAWGPFLVGLLVATQGCAGSSAATRDQAESAAPGPLVWEVRAPSGVSSWIYGQVFTPPGLEPPWARVVSDA